jgi:hypothetical protein
MRRSSCRYSSTRSIVDELAQVARLDAAMPAVIACQDHLKTGQPKPPFIQDQRPAWIKELLTGDDGAPSAGQLLVQVGRVTPARVWCRT